MKPIHFLAAVVFSLSGNAFAAGGYEHSHEHKSLHGGFVSEVKDMDYELVATPETIQLHLRDHGKPVDVSNASAINLTGGYVWRQNRKVEDGQFRPLRSNGKS